MAKTENERETEKDGSLRLQRQQSASQSARQSVRPSDRRFIRLMARSYSRKRSPLPWLVSAAGSPFLMGPVGRSCELRPLLRWTRSGQVAEEKQDPSIDPLSVPRSDDAMGCGFHGRFYRLSLRPSFPCLACDVLLVEGSMPFPPPVTFLRSHLMMLACNGDQRRSQLCSNPT